MTLWERKRQASGLSKTDMANELGLTFNYYRAIEKGDVKMPSNLVDKFNEIINRGKKNNLVSVENDIKADEFWNEVKQKDENGKYILAQKMKEFNVETVNQLANLIGYRSSGTIWNNISGRNEASVEFKKRLYSFFSNDLNVQIPKKNNRKTYVRKQVNKKVNLELDNYYNNTDFKKLLKDYNITNVQIAKEIGVHNSTVSNMTSKKYKPSYGIIADVKKYLDSVLPRDAIKLSEIPNVEPMHDVTELVSNIANEEQKKPETVNVIDRYKRELDEIEDMLTTYKEKIKDLDIRKKVCVEVLSVIDELNKTGE